MTVNEEKNNFQIQNDSLAYVGYCNELFLILRDLVQTFVVSDCSW